MALLGKNTHLVGLDIGSRTIKVGEVMDTKSGYSLKNFGSINITPGVIEEGELQDPEAVAGFIRELYKSNGIKAQNVAISIGGYSVIVKKISIQAMSEEELNEAISHEAEQYIPFDISEVNLDFQILGEAESSPEQMNVLLVAAKKEMIAEYIELVQSAGLNPCIIDVDAFALQNIFEINYDLPDEAVALIDIGAGKTSLNIVKGDSSLFMRDVSLGCHQINEQIVSSLDCSEEEAEAIKIDEKQEKMSPDEYSEIISSITTDWCEEIRKALDYYYSTDPEDSIQRIILSGGGAHISGLRDLLAAELSTEVENINPFGIIDIDSKKFEPSYLQQIAPQAAICLGLALRRVDDK